MTDLNTGEQEEQEVSHYLEIVRQRDYPSLTLEEMLEIFNATYERVCKDLRE